MFGNVSRQTGHLTVLHMGTHPLQHRVTKHFYQALAPVLDVALEHEVLFLKKILV